jgi:hypothetical protein
MLIKIDIPIYFEHEKYKTLILLSENHFCLIPLQINTYNAIHFSEQLRGGENKNHQ